MDGRALDAGVVLHRDVQQVSRDGARAPAAEPTRQGADTQDAPVEILSSDGEDESRPAPGRGEADHSRPTIRIKREREQSSDDELLLSTNYLTFQQAPQKRSHGSSAAGAASV